MATKGGFPRAYVNDIPREGAEGLMEYIPSFDTLGIGARRSGLPKGGVNNIKSLDHVGGGQGGAMRDSNRSGRPK
jgi:hypothetical protein